MLYKAGTLQNSFSFKRFFFISFSFRQTDHLLNVGITLCRFGPADPSLMFRHPLP